MRPIRPGIDHSPSRRAPHPTPYDGPDDRSGARSVARHGQQTRQKVEYPIAFVILGSLITSTRLNLYVLPFLFAKFGHRSLPQADRADSQIHLYSQLQS